MLRCHVDNKVSYSLSASIESSFIASVVFLARVDLSSIEAVDDQLQRIENVTVADVLTEAACHAVDQQKSTVLVAIKFARSKHDQVLLEARLQQFLYEREPTHIVPLAFKTCTCFYYKRTNGRAYPVKVSVYQPNIGRGGRTIERLDAQMHLSQSVEECDGEEDQDAAEKDAAEKIYAVTIATIKRISQHIRDSAIAVDSDDADWLEHRNRINGLYHDFDRNVKLPKAIKRKLNTQN